MHPNIFGDPLLLLSTLALQRFLLDGLALTVSWWFARLQPFKLCLLPGLFAGGPGSHKPRPAAPAALHPAGWRFLFLPILPCTILNRPAGTNMLINMVNGLAVVQRLSRLLTAQSA